MGSDEIDVQRARQYAWSLHLPDDDSKTPEIATEIATETVTESADEKRADWRADSRAKAAELAVAVERVWNGKMSDAQQALQVEAMLESAAELGLGMLTMSDQPLGPIRLARLAHRHWHRLSEDAQKNACGSLMWSAFEPALAVDLLVELCRDGNEEFAGMVSLPLFHNPRYSAHQLPFLDTGLAPQLIALLDGADSLPRPWASRLIALDWLQLAPVREAIPLLRRMLRLPHLEVRLRALALLVRDYAPSPLQPEDVMFLLEDLRVHPPDRGKSPDRYETSLRYSAFLHDAITTLRPDGGAEILEQLAFEGDFLRFGYRGELEGKWALIALAAAYPQRALSYIDLCMRNGSTYTRLVAVEAAAELPEEEARPRLVTLAADGATQVAEMARDCFIKRFVTGCPIDPLAGFPRELLDAAPSELLLGRLLCLRGPSQEARDAMVKVLLSEAPNREALALLTFTLCDDTLLHADDARTHMCVRLYRRFGVLAIAAFCWLSERYPESGRVDWLLEIGQLVQARKIRKRDLDPLRDLAVRWLEGANVTQQQRALDLLATTGAPAALKPRLLALAWSDEPSPHAVAAVLRKWPKDPALDAEILQEAQAAWARRDTHKLALTLSIGFGRRVRAFTKLAQQILTAWREFATAQRANGGRICARDAALPRSLALQCARHLHEKKQLDAETIQRWLATPEAPEFLLAAHLPLAKDDQAAKQALLVALNNSPKHKEVAQEAAAVLLSRNEFDPDDPILLELISEDTRQLRFWLIHHIAFGKCNQQKAHESAVAALLKTATLADDSDLVDYLPRFARVFGTEALKKALAEVPNRALRQTLLAILREEEEDEMDYWEDEDEALR